MNIQKAYYMSTNHVQGNYNKLKDNIVVQDQSIVNFFVNLCVQRIYDSSNLNSNKRPKLDLLDFFLLSVSNFIDIEQFLVFMEKSTRPAHEQIDNFLYPIYGYHKMYGEYNQKYKLDPSNTDRSLYKELFNHPEVKTTINSYTEFLKRKDENLGNDFKKVVENIQTNNEEKLLDILYNIYKNKPSEWYSASYAEMWFELSQQRVDEYDILEEKYSEEIRKYETERLTQLSLKQRKIDKLVALYDFKEKAKNIFKNIVGQREPLKQILQSLYNAQLGLNNPNGPKASMFLTGPTGVGKTETAYAISNCLYGKDPFVVDLAVYHGDHQLSTLIGAPPGYLGYSDKPQLLEYLENYAREGGVLLFDEFDKANPKVLNIFMHMLDKGEIQSAKGECYSVQNFIVITTSNITEKVRKSVGFGSQDDNIKQQISTNDAGGVPPELIARFDLVLAYQNLSKEEKIELAKRKMDIVCSKIKALKDYLNIQIKYDEKVLEEIACEADEKMGIRELFRNINSVATNKIVEYIMDNDDFTDFAVNIKSINEVLVKPLPKTKQSIELNQAAQDRIAKNKAIMQKELERE